MQPADARRRTRLARHAGDAWSGAFRRDEALGRHPRDRRPRRRSAAIPEIARVTGDSREVVAGRALLRPPRRRADGARLRRRGGRGAGAVAVVAERPVDCAPARAAPRALVAARLALAAANFHGRPGDALALAGVTGTNGKTTVTYLVEACARAAGVPAGVLGTVTHRFPGVERAGHATPRPESTDAPGAPRRDARRRRARGRARGLLPRARPGAGRRAALPRRRLHQPDARPPRLPRRHGGATSPPSGGSSPSTSPPDGVAVVNARDAARRAPRRPARPRPDASGASARARRRRAARGRRRARPRRHRAPRSRRRAGAVAGLARRSSARTTSRTSSAPRASRSALGLPPDAVARGPLRLARARPGRLERVDGARRLGLRRLRPHATTRSPARSRRSARLAPRRLVVRLRLRRRPRPRQAPAHGRGRRARRRPRRRDERQPAHRGRPARSSRDIVPGRRAGRAAPALRAQALRRASAGFAGRARPPRRHRARASPPPRPGDVVLVAGKGHEDYQIVGDGAAPLRRPRGGRAGRLGARMSRTALHRRASSPPPPAARWLGRAARGGRGRLHRHPHPRAGRALRRARAASASTPTTSSPRRPARAPPPPWSPRRAGAAAPPRRRCRSSRSPTRSPRSAPSPASTAAASAIPVVASPARTARPPPAR